MIDLAYASLRLRNTAQQWRQQWPQRSFNALIVICAVAAVLYALRDKAVLPESVNTSSYFGVLAAAVHLALMLSANQGLAIIAARLDWLSATQTNAASRRTFHRLTLALKLSAQSLFGLLLAASVFSLTPSLELSIWLACYLITCMLIFFMQALRQLRARHPRAPSTISLPSRDAIAPYKSPDAVAPTRHAAALHAGYFRGFQQSPSARARLAGFALLLMPMSAGFQLVTLLSILTIALLLLDRLIASQLALHHSTKWCATLQVRPAHWLRAALMYLAPISAIALSACLASAMLFCATASLLEHIADAAVALLIGLILIAIVITSALLGFAQRHLPVDSVQRSRNELLTWFGAGLLLQAFAPSLLLAPLLWFYLYRTGCKGPA
jgi:hypothetical protein